MESFNNLREKVKETRSEARMFKESETRLRASNEIYNLKRFGGPA